MDVLGMISGAKKVASEVATGQWIEAAQDAIVLQQTALDAVKELVTGQVKFGATDNGHANLGDAIEELDSACEAHAAKVGAAGDAPTVGFGLDPATFLMLFQAVAQLLSMIHAWRHPTPAPAPTP